MFTAVLYYNQLMAVENLKDDQLKALQQSKGYSQAVSLITLLEQSGFEAYLVGGCVRDVLIGRELKDFDMCTSATPEDMKRIFDAYRLVLNGEAFGTVSVVVDGLSYEITTYRGDGAYSDSRHPDSVSFETSLEEDLKRRDFTINALAFHPDRGVVDFVGGLADIENKVLKTVGDPKKRFEEDALRIARLVRFAVQLGFSVEQESLKAAKSEATSLKLIAKERIFTEFKKMVDGKPDLESLDQILGTSTNRLVYTPKQLDGFEKAFVAWELTNFLGVPIERYVLERGVRDKALCIQQLSISQDLKKDFIKACDKFSLFDSDQLTLWHFVKLKHPTCSDISVSVYSKLDVSKLTLKLKSVHQGSELGAKILSSKIKHFFCGDS